MPWNYRTFLDVPRCASTAAANVSEHLFTMRRRLITVHNRRRVHGRL
ncbi:hypothetical protein [Arthrobacter methylotrophus]